MIRCIKQRTWFIIIVLAMAILLIVATLRNNNEPEEPRTFGGTFVNSIENGCVYEYLYQTQEENQFM